MARGNDFGIEMIVQFGGAFLVGWMVSAMVHHLDAYQVCSICKHVCSYCSFYITDNDCSSFLLILQAANQGALPWIS